MKEHPIRKWKFSLAGIRAVPLSLFAKAKEQFRLRPRFRFGNGNFAGRSVLLIDEDSFTCKISSGETDGELYIFETVRIKEGGPDLHMHFEQDEWWYVLQGSFTIKVGDEIHEAKAGDTVFGPRMVPHAFAKTGRETGKMIMGFRPAGKMEAFFEKLARGALTGLPVKEQDRICEEHGFKRMGPPLKTGPV